MAAKKFNKSNDQGRDQDQNLNTKSFSQNINKRILREKSLIEREKGLDNKRGNQDRLWKVSQRIQHQIALRNFRSGECCTQIEYTKYKNTKGIRIC